MAEKIKITVYIAERKYNVIVEPSEEAIVRQAAQQLNQQIKNYAMNHVFKDREDLLVLISLENTRNLIETQRTLQYIDSTLGLRLKQIDSLLQDNI